MVLYAFNCAHCGERVERSYRGSGTRPTLCGNACKVAAYRIRNPAKVQDSRKREREAGPSALLLERMVYRRWSSRVITGYAARISFLRDRINRKAGLASSPCGVCGGSVGYSGNGRRKAYCSATCSALSEVTARNKRTCRATRRARERAADAERFDPIEILRRDGWRCHICGRSTPERLRGTFDDPAPELDHIIPLAAGGNHTRINTACACRKCNRQKGARPLGQLRLAA
jgi:5-methylcytosine-specific restriction endonuclease McrA